MMLALSSSSPLVRPRPGPSMPRPPTPSHPMLSLSRYSHPWIVEGVSRICRCARAVISHTKNKIAIFFAFWYCLGMIYQDNSLRARWIAGEIGVALGFAKMGYGISTPFAPLPYDLVVDTGQDLFRIQVKTAQLLHTSKWATRDRPYYSFELTRQRSGKTERFGSEEFDVLCAVCDENTYVIPTLQIISPNTRDVLLRQIHIKPVLPELTRLDSIDAGLRWESFRNNFDLHANVGYRYRNIWQLRELVQLILQRDAGPEGMLPSEIYAKCVAMGHQFSNRTNGSKGILNMLQRLQPKTQNIGNGRWIWVEAEQAAVV